MAKKNDVPNGKNRASGRTVQSRGNRNVINHNSGVDGSLVNQLIKSLREQVIYLQIELSNERKITEALMLSLKEKDRIIGTTLTYLGNTCQECLEVHKNAHKKLDKLKTAAIEKRGVNG